MDKQRGFTMIELMIVIAIIAILAAIAIPSYQDYVTRGQLPEAQSGLAAYRVAMEQYYQDNRSYAGAAGCGATPAPVYTYFTHTCATTNGGQGFTATATGSGGRVVGFTFTINEQNQRQTTAAPTNWQTATMPANCFIVRKGSC